MRPIVKICGITRFEDARYCAGAGADLIGFIQHRDSPRYIAPAAVRAMLDWLYGPEPVGVFVNEEADAINQIAREAGFKWAQLHGHESPETCAAVEVPVIKAFRVMHDASAEQLHALMEPYRDVARLFLLDTYDTNLWGGTGESFNWRLARELSTEFPLLVSGGIGTHNVAEALETIRPFGVDLSSSVEAAPGVKDFDRLSAFFDAFNEAADRMESTS